MKALFDYHKKATKTIIRDPWNAFQHVGGILDSVRYPGHLLHLGIYGLEKHETAQCRRKYYIEVRQRIPSEETELFCHRGDLFVSARRHPSSWSVEPCVTRIAS